MASLIDTARCLLGREASENEVTQFASKLVEYCAIDGPRATGINNVLTVFREEVMGHRQELGENAFREIAEVAREKILQYGGVTGFLPKVEGSGIRKRS